MNSLTRILGAATLFSLASLASATPAEDASAHFKAIAAGDVEQIMSGYGDNAVLQWMGGPLDGAYIGNDKMRETWAKFAKANAPLEASVAKLEESANPKGATVTANVEFKGKTTIKVRYVLVYREGKLVNEVWQIDPKLVTAAY